MAGLRVLACVKRVPAPGAQITLTADHRAVDARNLAFTTSPHEECAVEEAIRLVETHGGDVTVLTVGPPAAEEQLRFSVSVGAQHAVLVTNDTIAGGDDPDPQATAARSPKPSRHSKPTARSTCSSSATSRPTRAASRLVCASHARSAVRWSTASRESRLPTASSLPGASAMPVSRSTGSRCGGRRREGGHQSPPLPDAPRAAALEEGRAADDRRNSRSAAVWRWCASRISGRVLIMFTVQFHPNQRKISKSIICR